MRPRYRRNDADRCVSVVLRMYCLQCRFEAIARGLLRLLFLWHCCLPANTRRKQLLRVTTASGSEQTVTNFDRTSAPRTKPPLNEKSYYFTKSTMLPISLGKSGSFPNIIWFLLFSPMNCEPAIRAARYLPSEIGAMASSSL